MNADSTNTSVQTDQPARSSRWLSKLMLLVVVVSVIAVLMWQFGDSLSLEAFASRESQFREYKAAHPWIIVIVAFVAYVTVTGLSLPGAAAMSLLMGWLFGFWEGLVLVSFASTSGASIAFLFSRYLLKDLVEKRFAERLRNFHKALEREGAFYLFTLRLIPAVPFFVINVVMGVMPIRLWTFWWVSQLGMLPGTAAFIYAGASVPSLQVLAEQGLRGIVSPQLLIAFVILGILPLAIRFLMNRFRSQKELETNVSSSLSEPVEAAANPHLQNGHVRS